MAEISPAGVRRKHLVEQQLREHEAIDGLFEVRLDRIVAVTSERLMIVSGGDGRGWALTGIPWRLVTSVAFDAGEPDGVSTLEVRYTAHRSRSVRKGDDPAPETCSDICPDAIDEAWHLLDLLGTRVASSRASN